ncbi:hypothetical protein ACWDTT_11700 [Streptosporangium sandarakinum]
MDEDDLARVELGLRDALTGTSLEWVLDEVDAAIAAGVSEERVLRRRNQRGNTADDYDLAAEVAEAARYETVYRTTAGSVEHETSSKGGSLVITTLPMTIRQRVELLIEALRRVLIELPEIEEEAIKMLHTAPSGERGRRSEVTSVRFAPSQEAGRRTEREIELSPQRLTDRRETLKTLLADLASEVQYGRNL